MTRQELAFKNLGFTDEEIADIRETDRRIDKGEKLFELSAEQAKNAKSARTTTKTKTVYTFKPKPPKAPNEEKLYLMNLIKSAIGNNAECETYRAVEPERIAEFVYNGKKYKITLSMPRG